MRPRWETFEVSESQRFPELQGRRVTDLARERGCSPLDVMCELARRRGSRDPVPRLHRQRRRRRGRRPAHARATSSLGLSDAGAHVDQLCDAPLYTDLLGKWVRERSLMPLEKAVRKLSGEPADMFGFVRRGYLREGYWADVCVFDPDDGGPGPAPARARLPGRRRTPDRGPAHRRAARARQRHADPQRRALADRSLEQRPGMRPEIA